MTANDTLTDVERLARLLAKQRGHRNIDELIATDGTSRPVWEFYAANAHEIIELLHRCSPAKGEAPAVSKLSDALTQIMAVADDNKSASCDQGMALSFIRMVADKALTSGLHTQENR